MAVDLCSTRTVVIIVTHKRGETQQVSHCSHTSKSKKKNKKCTRARNDSSCIPYPGSRFKQESKKVVPHDCPRVVFTAHPSSLLLRPLFTLPACASP